MIHAGLRAWFEDQDSDPQISQTELEVSQTKQVGFENVAP